MTSEEHHSLSASGAIYSSTFAKYATWSRYLDAFNDVLALARVTEREPKENDQRADGPGVLFRPLPDYTGPRQYLQVRRHARIIARQANRRMQRDIVSAPGLVSQMVWREIMHAKKPYALEVMGDPWEALSPGTWPNISRPIFRRTRHRPTGANLRRRNGYPLPHVASIATKVSSVDTRWHAVGFPDAMLESTGVPADKIRRLASASP